MAEQDGDTLRPNPLDLPECEVCNRQVGWVGIAIEVEGVTRVFCERCSAKIFECIAKKLFFKNFTRAGSL